MTPPTSNISASGQIENALCMGFTYQDALNELIDNSNDAGATECRIRIVSATKTLYVDDDGVGMDEPTLVAAIRFHNTRGASTRNGLRGFGVNAAHIVSSEAKNTTHIFSKTDTMTFPVETALNWKQYRQDDIYNPKVNDLTVGRQTEWTNGAINPSHGTVMVIPMTDAVFSELTNNLDSVLEDLGRTYEIHLRSGFKITINFDGTIYTPDYVRALNWEETPVSLRNDVPVELWRHPETEEERIYYRHKHGRPIWEDMVRKDPQDPKKVLRDRPDTEAAGFINVNSIAVRNTYNPRWNPTTIGPDGYRMKCEPGYLSFCRNNRHLRSIPNTPLSKGDFEKRRVFEAVRSAIIFTHVDDNLFDIQVNKSQVNIAKVHPGILATAQSIYVDWAERLYKNNFKRVKDTDPEEKKRARELKDAMHKLKALAEVMPDWYDDFCEWLEDRVDDVSIGSDSSSTL